MILIRDNVERSAESACEIEKLKAQGFTVLSGEAPVSPEKEAPGDIETMTVAQLRKLARAKGIRAADSLSKADLLGVLEGME